MEIEIRYLEGCPSWESARDRVTAALEVVGRGGHPVTLRVITSIEDAERARFRGSPTVLVDGVDLFEDLSAPVGMSCRLYAGSSGLDGAPSTDHLVTALRHRLQ